MTRPDVEGYLREDWPSINAACAVVVSSEWLSWAHEYIQRSTDYIRAIEAAQKEVVNLYPHLEAVWDAAVERWQI